jgi:hypothetical protein
MLLLSFIVIMLVAYYLLTTWSIMLGQSTLKVHYHFIRKRIIAKEIDINHINTRD